MAVPDTVLPARAGRHRWTWDDLQLLPEDGRRYEAAEGALVVSPSPSRPHQDMVLALGRQLQDAAPPGAHVVVGPYDVVLPDGDGLVPDLLVGRLADLEKRCTRVPPMLVVEVLSAGRTRYDRLVKRGLYEDFGVPVYWIVDPEEPSLTVLELAGGSYRDVREVSGVQPVTLERPFPVTIRLG